jgi:hypothetical protein
MLTDEIKTFFKEKGNIITELSQRNDGLTCIKVENTLFLTGKDVNFLCGKIIINETDDLYITMKDNTHLSQLTGIVPIKAKSYSLTHYPNNHVNSNTDTICYPNECVSVMIDSAFCAKLIPVDINNNINIKALTLSLGGLFKSSILPEKLTSFEFKGEGHHKVWELMDSFSFEKLEQLTLKNCMLKEISIPQLNTLTLTNCEFKENFNHNIKQIENLIAINNKFKYLEQNKPLFFATNKALTDFSVDLNNRIKELTLYFFSNTANPKEIVTKALKENPLLSAEKLTIQTHPLKTTSQEEKIYFQQLLQQFCYNQLNWNGLIQMVDRKIISPANAGIFKRRIL